MFYIPHRKSHEQKVIRRSLRRVFPAPVSTPTTTRATRIPARDIPLLRLISVRGRCCRPGCIRILVVQEALVESEPRTGTARRSTPEARSLINVLVVVFTERVV